jgi:coenzyme F420 hydrogenase subunit beta
VGGYILPVVDLAVCTDCGVCRKVCPGEGLAPGVTDRLPADCFAGVALECYVGKVTDERLYANAQSGGIVSALLVDALKRKEIGGAVTVVMRPGVAPRAHVRLATNPAEIREAQKSKYCPVGSLSILSEVEKQERPVAFVGVGCQIQGLHNLCECFPRIRAKIAFTIGLICDRTMTYGATDYLLRRSRVAADEPKILHFRDKTCGGYPGSVNVVCSNGVAVSLPARARMGIKDFFTPARCRLCFDKMNVLADITVGDPWGVEGADTAGGESVAVIRTDVGRRIFRRACAENVVTAREIEYQEVLAGQRIERKRKEWEQYIAAWRNLGRPLPRFCGQIGRSCPSQPEDDSYRDALRHALALDRYASRERLLAAVDRSLFCLQVKRKIGWPKRIVKQMLERTVKSVGLGGR